MPVARLRILSRLPAAIPSPTGHTFDGRIALIGYELERTSVQPGEVLRGRLYFRGLAPIPRDYTVFVHVTAEYPDGRRTLVGQHDAQPSEGGFPTSTWQIGENFDHDFRIRVPADTPIGDMVLDVGWYDATNGQRLPVGDSHFVRLTPIGVRR